MGKVIFAERPCLKSVKTCGGKQLKARRGSANGVKGTGRQVQFANAVKRLGSQAERGIMLSDYRWGKQPEIYLYNGRLLTGLMLLIALCQLLRKHALAVAVQLRTIFVFAKFLVIVVIELVKHSDSRIVQLAVQHC